MLSSFHSVPFAYSRSRGHAELESEELIELVPPEETNPELTEGKPGCIPLIILDFCFNYYFIC
jgi:hypothetical protein